MVKLGVFHTSIYRDGGISLENRGCIVFKGGCIIDNESYLSIGQNARLVFGEGFHASANFRVVCYKSVEFARKVDIGWNTIVQDTDFHTLTYLSQDGGRKTSESEVAIAIEEETWIAMNCVILKGVTIPAHCVVAANSVVLPIKKLEEYSLIAGQPAAVKRKGRYRDFESEETHRPMNQ